MRANAAYWRRLTAGSYVTYARQLGVLKMLRQIVTNRCDLTVRRPIGNEANGAKAAAVRVGTPVLKPTQPVRLSRVE